MRKLLVFDKKDYSGDMKRFEKYSVRAVIIREGRIATQMGAAGEHKILGGGMEPGEDFAQSLAREVQEESGLIIIPETIREIGEIEEIRRDRFEPDKIYHCHSLFFFCEAEERLTVTHMTASEIEKGYHLVWSTPEEIMVDNEKFLGEPWIYRDTEFVRLLAAGEFDRDRKHTVHTQAQCLL